MSILSSLTGSAASRAGRQNRQAIQGALTAGTQSLSNGYNAAGAILGVRDGDTAIGQLGRGFDQARADVTGQYDRTNALLGQVAPLYQDMAAGGRMATDARLDALGLNGPEGNTRARTVFEGSLGYNAGLDEGLDAVMRTASARGNLAGGNTSRDLFTYGADYQNRQVGSYLSQLGAAGANYATGLTGQAQGLTNQAGASAAQGGALAALGTGRGIAGAGLYGAGSAQQADYGRAAAGLYGDTADRSISNNNTVAASRSQASSNLLNTIGGALQGFSGMGGFPGLSRLFGG